MTLLPFNGLFDQWQTNGSGIPQGVAGWWILPYLALMYLENQKIFIGGVHGGIGSLLAGQLLREGAVVGGFVRTIEQLDALGKRFPELDLFVADATDAAAVSAAVDAFLQKHQSIDSYAHLVGSVFLKPLHLTSFEDWDKTLQVNLYSAFHAAKAVVPAMRKAKSGNLVFMSSVAAAIGLSNHEAIAAAKAGIEGLAKSIAATYAPVGIRSNVVAPGLVETPATERLVSNAASREFSEKMHPLGRIGKPEDISAALRWLLSPDSSWVTGQVIGVDGGMSKVLSSRR